MKHKQLVTLFLVILMTIGMNPSFVLAKELYYGQNDQEAVETSESDEKEETKPEVKEPSKPKTEEPAEPKTEESAEPKTEEPAESKTEESAEPKTEKIPPQTFKQDKPSDNEELFKKYIENRLGIKKSSGSSHVRLRSIPSGYSLSTYNRNIYNALKAKIAEVAAGTKNSTVFTLTYDEIGIGGVEWNAEDLGVSSLCGSDGKLTKEAYDAFCDKANSEICNISLIHNALLADCPYELYWYDKTIGVSVSGISYSYVKFDPYITFNSANSLTFRFYVANGYGTGTKYVEDGKEIGYLQIDTNKIDHVNNAISNAKKVVDAAKDKTDYEKLVSYRNWICNQVSYDHNAANGGVPYGDPWQLISVFDGDSSTNIVCEGYAKAFMYLCELTSFDTSIQCITVTGDTTGGHMWNIVNMEDGKNYMVDLTNCDAGYSLFLVGYKSSNYSDIYTFDLGNHKTLTYKYDEETLSIYDKELVISSTNYKPASVSGTCGNDLQWTLSGGVLNISGTGNMTNWSGPYVSPWNSMRADIKKIIISGGVTSIGNYAFYGCSNLTSVTGGAGLKTIGTKAFGRCPKLKTFKITSKILKKIGSYAFYKDTKLKTIYIKYTTKLTKSGVKKSLKSSKVKTVKVKRSKIRKYRAYFRKKNSGRYVTVKK